MLASSLPWACCAFVIASIAVATSCAKTGSSDERQGLGSSEAASDAGPAASELIPEGGNSGAAPSGATSQSGSPGLAGGDAAAEGHSPVVSSPIDVVVPVPQPDDASGPPPSSQPEEMPSSSTGGTNAVEADPPGPGSDGSPDAGSFGSDFSIELSFDDEDTLEPAVVEAFASAKARWEAVIHGDLPDVTLSDQASCDGHDLPEALDDIVIFVTVSAIDGTEGVLGAAGPCAIRGRAPRLPFAASMRFDEADLSSFAEIGRLEEIVLHEMGHALGIGSLWEEFGLVDDASDGSGVADTAFNGAAAREAFEELSGGAYVGNIVPVENLGTDGEINGHWREAAMGSELMTTRMGSGTAQLSAVTIASLEDMGYEVDHSLAEAYTWPSIDGDFSFLVVGPVPRTVDLTHDRLDLPLQVLADDGRLFRVRN